MPAIFFDIDGTLRDIHTGGVPQSTVVAVRKLRDGGYFLGVATGRSMLDIEDNIREVVDWDAYVCLNGQEVYTKLDGKIYGVLLPDDLVLKCIEIAEKSGRPVQLDPGGSLPYLTREPDDAIREAYDVFNITVPEVRPYRGEPITAVMVFGAHENDFGEYENIKETGVCVYPGAAKDTSGAVYADIALKGISKYSGIEKVLERYGIGGYIAFGDSCNDLEMMLHAEISVAMGDSHRSIEAVATHRTKTAAEGGIEAACEKLELYSQST